MFLSPRATKKEIFLTVSVHFLAVGVITRERNINYRIFVDLTSNSQPLNLKKCQADSVIIKN